ncbi:MAG: ATP-binding protein [Bacteroidota bacterium]
MVKLVVFFFLILPVSVFGRRVSKAKVDSLISALPSVKNDSARALLLADICYKYADIDPARAIEYGREGLPLAEKLKWKDAEGKILSAIAVGHQNKGDYDSGLIYSLQSLRIYEVLGNRRNIAVNFGIIANGYQAKGQLNKSLEYHFKSLKIVEEINDKDLRGSELMSVGNIYFQAKDLEKALQYHKSALALAIESQDTVSVARCYLNIGNVYYEKTEYARALEYFFNSLQINDRMRIASSTQLVSGNIASTYIAMHNYPKALEYAVRAHDLSKQLQDAEGDAYGLADIGKIYLGIARSGNKAALPDSVARMDNASLLAKAANYTKLAIERNKDVGDRLFENDCLLSLSDIYRQMGDYKNALGYYEAHTRLKDTLFSRDNKVNMAEQETKREAELKEKQIAINRLEKADGQRKIFSLAAGVGCLLLVTIVVVRTNNKQKLANRHLAEEKETSDKLRVNLEESLEQKSALMEQLSVAADMKSRFIANISHELRTPVTLLTGMLELMREKETTVDVAKMEVAYNNSRRLQYMVNEILDLSKLDKYEDTLKKEVKEVVPTVKRMVNAFAPYIEQQHLTLRYNDNGIHGFYVSTDEEKLEKIINNLVYNAVKFNKDGGYIDVSLSLTPSNRHINITIADSGIGINEKDLPYIFERYYQGDSKALKAQGSGIGLSLVKEFTELLNGTVMVASTPDTGTTFTLQFPVFEKSQTAEIDTVAELPEERWEDFEKVNHVLIVEDNSEMRYYLQEILGGRVKLSEAENGKKALAWLQNNQPDLIITDIMMPEMNGREFIAALKESEKYKTIPVITLSALADIDNQLTTLRLGIDDYIVKPFNARELRIRIYNLLKNLQERRLFGQQPAEPDDIPADSKQAGEFRSKVTEYVVSRMKNFDVTVFDLAYQFSLSERQLYRLAKSLTGCTPAQLIKEVRLQKAYELLLSGNMHKVETVAKEVGYDHVTHFTRQFFERFGKKPAEFL